MTRSTELWVGKNDDEKIPTRVRVRVFEREGGRCWISGRKIMPGEAWELDHKIALVNGGRHSEDIHDDVFVPFRLGAIRAALADLSSAKRADHDGERSAGWREADENRARLLESMDRVSAKIEDLLEKK